MDPEYECPLCGSLMRLSNDVCYYDNYERGMETRPLLGMHKLSPRHLSPI